MRPDTTLAVIAHKTCVDDHNADAPCVTHLARVNAEYGRQQRRQPTVTAAAIATARTFRAYGTCGWCGEPDRYIAVDSSGGARCQPCTALPLCDWCGEAPEQHDGLCVDCAN